MIQVRRSTWRDQDGFLICGRRNGGGFPVAIFARSKDIADRIAAKVRRGEHIGRADFLVGAPSDNETGL